MLRTVFALMVSVFLSMPALAAPEIGKPAPAFTAMDAITGKPVTLESLKGKTVVLEWNNFHCPFIKKFYSVGAMQELQSNVTDDGVVWVSINSSAKGKEGYMADAATVKKELKKHNSAATHYLLDAEGTIGHAYEAKTTPHMFIIDAEGTLVYMGAIDDKPTADSADIASARNYVTEGLAALKHGKRIKQPVTKPYGCFVKY